ncbi:MAG TPA: sugar transferase [Acetobacteraceae bacterium]|jgi:undecaprenyl-phosphate galactose phosphotransferase
MKRVIDCALAATALIILSPILAIIALMVGMDGGPVIFAHPRVGRNGKLFRCYKFRTMFVGASECFKEYLALHPNLAIIWSRDWKLEFDPRITDIGRVLRKTSLDELPQLFNVLCGDMSLVGPRPVTETELVLYGDHADDYLSVRPGVTGLWQVSGRNRLSYEYRVALDSQYVKTQSFWRDIIILCKTARIVFKGDGQ